MSRVTPPDMEAWLAEYLRAELAAEGLDVQVANKEPKTLTTPLKRPLVVIRDDSGSRLDWVTFDRSIGVSVLAGTRADDKKANDLARLVASILGDDAIATVQGSPIAAVEWDGCNGPYATPDDHDVARRYLTLQYTVVGTY